jgi:hypothetical protein
MLAVDATVKSRENPVPAVSVTVCLELNMPIIKSLAFNPVTPAASAGAVFPPLVCELVPG